MLKWYSKLTGHQRSAVITVAGLVVALAVDYTAKLDTGVAGPLLTSSLTYLAARLNDAAQAAAREGDAD